MIWTRIISPPFKTHNVIASLAKPIEDDLRARLADDKTVCDKTVLALPDQREAGLDHGGGMISGRPYEAFNLRGYVLSVPSEHLGDFVKVATAAPVRLAQGRPYIKIHSYWSCVVVSPSMRDMFIERATARAALAARRHTEFYASWRARLKGN
jgi:hypothetical protein